MKKAVKLLSVFLAICVIAVSLCSCAKKAQYEQITRQSSQSVTAVTFNCAAPWGNVIKGTGSSARVKRFAQYMAAVAPDFIGTQEMNGEWLEKLSALLPDYESYGVKRGGDENERKSEINAVFWLKSAYEAVEKGTFWLSETPEKESRYEGAGCNRVCTWVVLKQLSTGKLILFMNTHLDNASEEAADYGAQVIVDKMAEITSLYDGISTVLTGDFNETQGMQAYNTAASALTDTLTAFPERKTGTYQDWGAQDNEEPIDFIFVSPEAQTVDYQVLNDLSGGYVSDHFGVYSEFVI